MKKILFTLLIILLLTVFSVFMVFRELNSFSKMPLSENALPRMIDISSGQTLDSVSRTLQKEEIINNPLKFKLLARIKGFDRRVKAGQYLLSASMPPEKILETIVEGKIYLYRITIPEGYNLHQIAVLMDETGIIDATEFLKAAHDSNFTQEYGIDANNFEGYLFPETYFFSKGMSPRKIISTMVNQFYTNFNPIWDQRPDGYGFSLHEIVTLASIVEKETGIAEERPLVSSVFHNRLRKNMRLQSDPTVIYGVDNFDGNLTRKHLNTPTPYNTYIQRGLPPGPIANPGKASLEAALFPPESPYLYFVSKKDKTHFFSTNYEDHRKAVKKYQLNQ